MRLKAVSGKSLPFNGRGIVGPPRSRMNERHSLEAGPGCLVPVDEATTLTKRLSRRKYAWSALGPNPREDVTLKYPSLLGPSLREAY